MSYNLYGLACPNPNLKKKNSRIKEECRCKNQQKREHNMEAKGQLINSVTGTNFKANTAHIVNLTNGEATVTQQNGFFVIKALPSDDLKITHVGFGDLFIKASELSEKVFLEEENSLLDEIVLSPKIKKNGLIFLSLAISIGALSISANSKKNG